MDPRPELESYQEDIAPPSNRARFGAIAIGFALAMIVLALVAAGAPSIFR